MDISTSTIIAIPLDDLRESPLNARTIDPKSLEEMVASIAAEGLLQNLTVTEASDGLYEVVAGKRRLGALRILRDRGTLPVGLQSPPCRVVDDERALSASLAENVVREAMHPADEFVAFRNLADNGRSIEEIAAEFGVLPVVVERRLRLARVAPALFELFRTGQMKLDQVMALAITDDHSAQEAAWNTSSGYERDASRLRDKLCKSEIHIAADPAASYVGADAIAAAGGVVRRDLFSDSGDGYVSDRLLVDQLALEKLERDAEPVRDEGWSWVEARVEFNTWDKNKDGRFERIHAEVGKSNLSDVERDQLDAFTAEYYRLENAEDLSVDDEAEAADRMGVLETEIKALEERATRWTPAQLAKAGAILTIGQRGELRIERGLVRAADAKQTRKAEATSGSSSGGGGVAKPDLSQSMLARIGAQRTSILQSAVMKSPEVALALLTHALLRGLFHEHSYQPVLCKIRFEGPGNLLQAADELPMMRHFIGMKDAVEEVRKQLPSETALLTWLMKQPRDVILSLLTLAVSQSIDTRSAAYTSKESAALIASISAAVHLDYADHWEPTRETFLNHVPRIVIEEAVRETRGETEVAKLATHNKKMLVEAAEQLLAGTGWVPKALRYAGAKAKPTTPAVLPPAPASTKATKTTAKPVKKAAAKKARPKATKKPPAKKSGSAKAKR